MFREFFIVVIVKFSSLFYRLDKNGIKYFIFRVRLLENRG